MEPFMQTILQISISMAAVIGLLLLLVPVWQKRYSAQWRKVIWLVIAVRLLIPFSIELPAAPVQVDMDLQRVVAVQSYPNYADDGNDAVPAMPANATAPSDLAVNINSSVTTSDVMVQNGVVWSQGMILFAVWLAGVFVFLLWHGVQYVIFRRKVNTSMQPLDNGEWLLHRAGAELNLNQYPSAAVSHMVQGPMLTGFTKPVILLPDRTYSEQELLLILRHELTHYKHRDLWYKLVLLFANAVHWFNPLVWMMNRQAGRDVEQVCDDAVVAGQDMAYRKAYSMTILNTMASQRGIALSTYLSKEAQNTKKRFAGILQPKQYKKGVIVLAGVILLAIAASGCLQFTKPVAGEEYLEWIEDYLPEGLDFGDQLEYEKNVRERETVHYWLDYADKTEQKAVGIQGKVDELCWITLITDNNDNITTYDISYDSGYHVREQLPESPLSNAEAKQLAEKFVTEISGESDLQFESWKPNVASNYRLTRLMENEAGWIADSAEEDYHYEVIVNTKYGHVQYFCKFYDNAELREQVFFWLKEEASETFQSYPRIERVELITDFYTSREEDSQYWLYVPVRVSYIGERDAKNPDSIWSMQPADDSSAEKLDFNLPIQICASIRPDGTLDLENRQLYTYDVDEDGEGVFRPITGFEVFIEKSLNAMVATASWDYSELRNAAENFADMLARVTSAESEIARDRIDNNAVIQTMTLPDYAYFPESSVTVQSIHTDFFRRYGQLGNDGESYEPVALSAEMQKEDGSTDTLTMWLITEDGEWKVADAVLEPFAESEEPLSFWEYSGYLDAFPWENTGDSPQFSYDYDGDGEIDRVYRSRTQADDYYQYQIEFANADILKIEEPVADVGYPQIDGTDLTGDGQNEIIFQVSYPTSTNPLAVGELAVFEQKDGIYQLMELPFETEEDSYVQKFPVIYSKAENQAVEVSVAGTDFKQVIPIDDDLWNGYLYKDNFANGETMESTVWAYKIQQQDGRYQMVCSVQLFDKWSQWGLDITLAYKNGGLVIDEIQFCEDVYADWF